MISYKIYSLNSSNDILLILLHRLFLCTRRERIDRLTSPQTERQLMKYVTNRNVNE